MNVKKTLLFVSTLSSLLLFPLLLSFSQNYASTPSRLGVWITVFSPEKILNSTDNVDRLIETCKRIGINDIYLQVYRADKAYYDSDLTDSTPYKNILSESGEDTLKYLIKKAKTENIDIHAWLNILSIATNENANILTKVGKGALTLDQHGRTSITSKKKDRLDKYYIRENQIFLEPGNEHVRDYITAIAGEIVEKYPGLSGIHLDYIRYPRIVPFVPGARFDSHGISYGYTYKNMKAFKQSSGIHPKKMDGSRAAFQKWDDWRRAQLTALVGQISNEVKKISPTIKISCTVIASVQMSYLTTFQDWTTWLKKDLIDYVVAMNYTDDLHYFKITSSTLLSAEDNNSVYIGVGAYLLKEDIQKVKEELLALKDLSPGGIVIFSYDDIAANSELEGFLENNFK